MKDKSNSPAVEDSQMQKESLFKRQSEKCCESDRASQISGRKSSKINLESAASNLLSGIEVSSTQCVAASRKGFWSIHSFRHGLSWVLCAVVLAHTWGRSTLSMAMVCMVNGTAVAKRPMLTSNYQNFSSLPTIGDDKSAAAAEALVDSCVSDSSDGPSNDYHGDIVWTSSQQGLLFSAVSWGSVLMGLPGSWLINRFGPKRVVTYCQILILCSTLVTPTAAIHGGLLATFFVRFCMGFGGEIVVNTAITVIMSQWIPPAERSTVLALYTAGNQIAIMLAMPVNAALCENRHFLGGWKAIFYMSGVITVFAGVLWHVFVDNTPDQSRWLSKKERTHIRMSLQSQNLGNINESMSKVPWRKLLLSNAVLSCVASIFSTGLIVMTLQSYLPTYYKEVHKIDIRTNGLFSALPFLCQLISKMIFAVAADAMKKRTRISHTAICKGFNFIGTIVSPALLVACAFMDCRRIIWALILLSLSNACYSGIVPGVLTALVCFAPAYTGIVNGIARLAAQVAAIVSPYIVGAITTEGTAEEWRTVFCIMSGVMMIIGIYFFTCGTVEIQDWAKIQDAPVTSENAENGIHAPKYSKKCSVITVA